MANGNFVRPAKNGKGSVVFGPTVYDVPLLPFEKQLIATIGVTEEEYQRFTAEAKRRGVIRPAAYENIPDIECIWPLGMAAPAAAAAAKGATATVLTNIAIGVVISGIGYLLTPKPKMPAAQKQGGIIDLGSVTGASRFTPSRGFETLAELADYASPIPLIFGLYKDDIGGMLTTPKLIWSRMFSHGTMQRAKLMFVVGEQGVGSAGIQPPELEGIFLGNNALDAVFDDLFAFYWHADSSSTFRIRGTDKRYGTRGKAHRGDPDVPNDNSDAFIFPLSGYEEDPSEIFCHAYTPSNNAKFGVYGAIANGTNYRVNYQLISIPKVDDEKGMAIRTLERIKIVGDSGVKSTERNETGATLQGDKIVPGEATKDRLNEIRTKGNHAGAGRNYSPRMGITEYNGSTVDSGNHRKTFLNIVKGDKALFVIRNTSIDPDFYRKDGKGASVDDINSTVESFQVEADSTMQVGEHFEVGGCIWKVIKRKLSMFDPLESASRSQEITLECVDTSTSVNRNLGIVSETLVVNPSTEFIGDSAVGDDISQGVGEAFFPLTQVEIATIKNNRPAVATEIGLKSTVFQRLSGLCNFQSLPTPAELNDAEEDKIQMNSGSISASVMRSSIFRIFIRDVNGTIDTFNPLPQFFVVRGQTPVAQYNYIRFTLEKAVELEYKFVPVSASEFRDLPENTPEFIVLSQSISTDQNENGSGGFFEFTEPVPGIGSVDVQVSGERIIGKTTFKANKEFSRGFQTVAGRETLSYPASVAFHDARPDALFGTTAEIGGQLTREANIADPSDAQGKLAAFFYTIAGSADDFTIPIGNIKRFESVEYIGESTTTWLHLEWRLKKKVNILTYASGEESGWEFVTVTVLGSGGGFSDKQKIEVKRGSEATNVVSGQADYPDTNPFVSGHPDGPLKFSGMRLLINGVTEDVKLAARSQAWRYEIFGAVGSRSEGDQKTVTRTFNKGSKSIRVDLTATVTSFRQNPADINSPLTPVVGQSKGWTIGKVTQVYQTDETSKTWNIGEIFTSNRTVSADNPFKTVYNRVGQAYRITDVSYESTEPPRTEAELFFAEQTQVADISAYRGFVEKSNSNGPEHEIVYINEAQLNDNPANMFELTIAGLSLKASRNFTALDQMRCWLGSGLPVERLHPNPDTAYGDASTVGPSNLFTDLVYFLLTDQQAGAGGLLGMDSNRNYLVDKNDLIKTSRFLATQKLFFNGPIVERTNLRQFISDIAPYFLCNFIISDGKFSLKPAVPAFTGGAIDTGAVQVDQLFTSGNILEDTYKLEYLGAEERRAFKAVVRYRQERKNKLPEEQVVIVKGADGSGDFASPGTNLLPEEQFDLTQFCTSRGHAVKVAKYFLALRAYVTHTISFSTTAEGLNIQAGSYIKIVTESSPYSAANNGSVSASGAVTSVTDMPDGIYSITYFKSGNDDIESGSMQISNGTVSNSSFYNIVFTVQSTSVSENIYIVEQLTFSQEGIVDIVASEHPCNTDGGSKIAVAVNSDDGFSIES